MFAVVSADLIDNDKVVSCLRYIPSTQGVRKVSTKLASQFLTTNYPHYLHYLKHLDTVTHAVPMSLIKHHYQPVERLKQICAQPVDHLERLTSSIADYFIQHGLNKNALGISGSILISTHGPTSDIDLVVYGRENFFHARNSLQESFASKHLHHPIKPLTTEQWKLTWLRRSCDLSLQDYIWHEQRKFNKACIEGVKFDLSMVESQSIDQKAYSKQGTVTEKAVITDDSKAYDYPVRYLIDHPEIQQIICYSATYAGQACTGEHIEAKGILEQADDGDCRLLVGSSREASGEYLKVLKTATQQHT